MMPQTRHVLAGVLAITIVGALLGCSNENPLDLGDSSTDSSITIGSQDSAESEILGQIYGQVLVDAGYDVDYNLAIGERDAFIPALTIGTIDLIPDYAGTALYDADPTATATSTGDVAAALPSALRSVGLVALNAAEAESGAALVVTPEFSIANNILAIGDLAVLGGGFTLGADSEFEAARYGVAGLQSVYGVSGFTVAAFDEPGGARLLQELLDHKVQVADIQSSDPSITIHGLVVLDDPSDLIPAQNIVPLLDKDSYSYEIAGLLNPVTAKLTTAELRGLNAAYLADTKPSAASIATAWLTVNGFLV